MRNLWEEQTYSRDEFEEESGNDNECLVDQPQLAEDVREFLHLKEIPSQNKFRQGLIMKEILGPPRSKQRIFGQR